MCENYFLCPACGNPFIVVSPFDEPSPNFSTMDCPYCYTELIFYDDILTTLSEYLGRNDISYIETEYKDYHG